MTNGGGALVVLNIYDLTDNLNNYLGPLGMGAYHSGVVVYGLEYAFYGHPGNHTGVFITGPGQAEFIGEQYKYKESIVIGRTDMRPEKVQELVLELGGDKYTGVNYHLLNRNCNHFSAELVQRLCGRSIPSWVNRLATMISHIPIVQHALPVDMFRSPPMRDEPCEQ